MKTLDLETLAARITSHPPNFALLLPDDESARWFVPGGWGFTSIGTHREADTVTRSNWRVITADLLTRFPEAFREFRCSHWAVGWYTHLAVDTSDRAALAALAKWEQRLAGYPVASDDDLSELEFTEACEYWKGMSVRDRLRAIRTSGARVSPFAARRPELPADDSGGLLSYLNGY